MSMRNLVRFRKISLLLRVRIYYYSLSDIVIRDKASRVVLDEKDTTTVKIKSSIVEPTDPRLIYLNQF